MPTPSQFITKNQPGKSFEPLMFEWLEDRCVPATLTVNTLADDGGDAGELTLREAIEVVNAGSLAGLSDDGEKNQIVGTLGDNDTILFSTGSGSILIGDSGAGQELYLTKSLTINASTITGGITIDAQDDNRVLNINTEFDDITVTLNNLTIQNGYTTEGGGGINFENAAGDTLNLINCTITGNQALDGGGGLYAKRNAYSGANPATLNIQGGTFSDNTAGIHGGGIYWRPGYSIIQNAIITGNQAGFDGGGMYAGGHGIASISNTQFTDNTANSHGGGLFIAISSEMTIDACLFQNNQAPNNYGGGVYNFGELSLTNTTISGNTATNGGGLSSAYSDSASVYIANSTISYNTATASYGGGLNILSAAHIVNSTISHNQAQGAFSGGGGVRIRAYDATLTNCTIIANSANTYAGGLYVQNANITVNNCIIAGNTAGVDGNDVFIDGDSNADGSDNLFSTDGTNIDFSDNVIEVENIDDVLETTLADNGGPTPTHALIFGSLAIDNGENDLALDRDGATLQADQRGFKPRIAGDNVDIGAVEYNAVGPVILSSEVGDSTFAAFYVTLELEPTDTISLDDIDVAGGVARQLVDNGDNTYTMIIAPDSIGEVTVSVADRSVATITTTFASLSFGTSTTEFIQNLYTVIFARSASDAEVEYWTQLMAGGTNRTDILAGFLASDEFSGPFSDNSALVDGLYQLLFDREADTTYWADLLDDGASIQTVIQGILSSEEYFIRAVQETYNEFLLRPADATGQAYWVDELLAGRIDIDTLRAIFQSSTEAEELAT